MAFPPRKFPVSKGGMPSEDRPAKQTGEDLAAGSEAKIAEHHKGTKAPPHVPVGPIPNFDQADPTPLGGSR